MNKTNIGTDKNVIEEVEFEEDDIREWKVRDFSGRRSLECKPLITGDNVIKTEMYAVSFDCEDDEEDDRLEDGIYCTVTVFKEFDEEDVVKINEHCNTTFKTGKDIKDFIAETYKGHYKGIGTYNLIKAVTRYIGFNGFIDPSTLKDFDNKSIDSNCIAIDWEGMEEDMDGYNEVEYYFANNYSSRDVSTKSSEDWLDSNEGEKPESDEEARRLIASVIRESYMHIDIKETTDLSVITSEFIQENLKERLLHQLENEITYSLNHENRNNEFEEEGGEKFKGRALMLLYIYKNIDEYIERLQIKCDTYLVEVKNLCGKDYWKEMTLSITNVGMSGGNVRTHNYKDRLLYSM